MNEIFTSVLESSRDASILALAVGGLLLLLGNKISAQWRHLLWMPVVIRLLLPALPPSPFSWQQLWKNVDQPESVSLVESAAEKPVITPADAPLPVAENIAPKVFVPVVKEPVISSDSSYSFSWGKFLFSIWLSGFVISAGLLMIGWIRFQRKIKCGKVSGFQDEEKLQALTRDLAKEWQLRAPRLCFSDALSSPALTGWPRATLLLPPGVIAKMDEDEISYIIQHELAHQKRHDVALQWVISFLLCVHWFNPFLHWACHRMRIEAERSADELVLRRTGPGGHTRYGKTLLRLLEFSDSTVKAPGAVGVLENFRDLQKRITRIGRFKELTGWRPRVLALVCLSSVAAVGLTGAPAGKEKPLTLAGMVLDEQQKPVANALVQIYTATPKQGPRLLCPSCYDDCGKEVLTDKSGNFEIEDPDPSLRFRLLVLAEGFDPEYIDHFDPVEGPVSGVLKKRYIDSVTPEKLITGQLVDAQTGQPVPGAKVSPYVWASAPGSRSYPARHVEKATITDREGRFSLIAEKAGLEIGIRIEARGLAHKKYTWLTAGKNSDPIPLEAGQTVTGRVLRDGKPVAGLQLGMTGTKRWSFVYLGEQVRATNENGEFTFTNIPKGDHYLYSSEISRATIGETGIRTRVIPIEADSGQLDLGTVEAAASGVVSGKITLLDGKKVPEGTNVSLDAQRGWNIFFTKTKADGSFTFRGVGIGEEYDLSADLDNYRISAKNDLPYDSGFRDISFELNDTEMDGINLVLAPIKTNVDFPISILQPDGKPAANAQYAMAIVREGRTVRPVIRDGELMNYFPLEVKKTNGQGKAILYPAIDRDEWLVIAHKSGWFRQSWEKLKSSERPISIRLNPWAKVKGTVEAPGKRTIKLRASLDDDQPVSLMVTQTTQTNESGNFEADALLAGGARVYAHFVDKENFVEWEKSVVIAEGETNQIEIPLPEGPEVVGRIDPGNEMMNQIDWQNSLLRLRGEETTYGVRLKNGGSFTFDHLPPGSYSVYAEFEVKGETIRASDTKPLVVPEQSGTVDIGVIDFTKLVW